MAMHGHREPLNSHFEESIHGIEVHPSHHRPFMWFGIGRFVARSVGAMLACGVLTASAVICIIYAIAVLTR